MSVIPNDELKVVATFVMPGITVAQNVYYCRYDGEFLTSNQNVADDMLIWVEDMMAPFEEILTTLVTLSAVTVFKKISADPLEFEQIGDEPGSFAGIETSDTIPNGVAMVIRVATQVGGRLARKYIAGVSEGFVEAIAFTSGAITAAGLFAVEWIAGPATQGAREYVSGIISVGDGTFRELGFTAIVSVIPGYQRRRKPGVGA